MIKPTIADLYWDGTTLEYFDSGTPTWVRVIVEMRPEGLEGADLFYGAVCNPAWMNANPDIGISEVVAGVTFVGNNIVLMEELDLQILSENVEKVIKSVGPVETWVEFGRKINKYFSWEYFGYTELR